MEYLLRSCLRVSHLGAKTAANLAHKWDGRRDNSLFASFEIIRYQSIEVWMQ